MSKTLYYVLLSANSLFAGLNLGGYFFNHYSSFNLIVGIVNLGVAWIMLTNWYRRLVPEFHADYNDRR